MNKSLIDKTYYEILDIVPSARPADVERAYKKAKETYSPNSPALYSVFTPHEAKELARLIEDAYSVLINPQTRHQYDARINAKANTQPMTKAKHEPPIQLNNDYLDYSKDISFEEVIESATEFSGEFLKEIREYKKVSIPLISEKSRISKTYIKAIEDNNYDKLPASVFVRGFVDQYAKLLKLDHKKISTYYVNKVKEHRGEN